MTSAEHRDASPDRAGDISAGGAPLVPRLAADHVVAQPCPNNTDGHECSGVGQCQGPGGHPRAHAHGPGDPHPADSHGVPWADRELSDPAYADDDGAPDPAVIAALARAAGETSSAAEVELMGRVAAARWLVPLVSVAVDTESRDGMRVQGHAEMATAILTAPDGRRALPVFSGVPALAAWDPAARPQPVTAAQAAQAAVADECDTLLLDVGSPHAVALRPSMVWALAMARPWVPAYEDPTVAAGVAAALASEPEVLGHDLSDGPHPTAGVLRVTIHLRPGLDRTGVEALATRVGERIATDGELRARIDGLSFAIRGGLPG